MSDSKSYGVLDREVADSAQAEHLQELRILGYTIVPNVLTAQELSAAREKLDAIYIQQENETGRDALASIKEKNMARCPLAYDDFFLELARKPVIIEIANAAIGGGYIILHLQNGIINRPNEPHHQSAWHRDLPYQEYVSSRPLAIGALLCVDNFSVETGCTHVLPHSHRIEKMPSETYTKKYEVPAVAAPGSAIVFDAMLYHRAGYNASQQIRRGINNVYSVPILKQQIDLQTQLQGRYGQQIKNDPSLAQFLGYTSSVPGSVTEYRKNRLAKFNKTASS